MLTYLVLSVVLLCLDLKPENFLLKDETDDAVVKIIDFGLSRFCTKGPMKSRVGTIYYVAPVRIKLKYRL